MDYQLVLLEWWVVGELSVSVDGVVDYQLLQLEWWIVG